MRYLPHTDQEIEEMLAAAGVAGMEDLFATIPQHCRYLGEMELPAPLDEWQLSEQMADLGGAMGVDQRTKILFGAGSNHHHVPETIRALSSRSEFLTAYTPYQPEMAQGTLQGIYEYQTLTARLLGMDVANASMYDGASALAEALLMALRIKKKTGRVAVSRAIHPHYRQVVRTYLEPAGYEIVELAVNPAGQTDLDGIAGLEGLAAVAVQSPNFFGVVEQLAEAADTAHAAGALLITGFTEPLAYGLLKNPGECGADIVCGEGQSFGMARSFGGAGLGMFGCRSEFTRSMPGRLVGTTTDLDGRRGFVLTLSTREQHIRREKATSNICSNQGICSLIAAMYMASLGGTGMGELATLNHSKAEYLKSRLLAKGAREVFSGPTFNEFVVEFPFDFQPVRERLKRQNIIAGLELGTWYPELAGRYLFCATETAAKEILDRVADEVQP